LSSCETHRLASRKMMDFAALNHPARNYEISSSLAKHEQEQL